MAGSGGLVWWCGEYRFKQSLILAALFVFIIFLQKKNPGPRSVPRSGENPAVKKSQHKSPLIFFYAAPPFSGLALPT
jgi:hypothetical protein